MPPREPGPECRPPAVLAREVRTFAPGRVNLIGEHTDYNRGLALPFAIAQGVAVRGRAIAGGRIVARALDLDERDEFAPGVSSARPDAAARRRAERSDGAREGSGDDMGWRGFVRGIAAELRLLEVPVAGAELEISGDLPRNAGLSSSAALEVSLALALLGLAGAELECRELARLCSRVENEWLGAHTGLLDQLASLYGKPDWALRIDFASLAIDPVPLPLDGGWRLATLDSGEPRALAASGYNERRAECTRACELLGVQSLRDADADSLGALPHVLARRARHVLEENARVEQAVAALRAGELERMGALLDAAHASLRDLYECSTPAVEAAVARLKRAGAAGARIVGGGFGGHVLGLFPPGASPPADALEVRPSAGARLLA
ncbi:MAG TPA: galactokinase family protein [Solirubrobacteraceae bacterium]|nr:galactokinase family protein [Solirubrobacteraceae bacterium]